MFALSFLVLFVVTICASATAVALVLRGMHSKLFLSYQLSGTSWWKRIWLDNSLTTSSSLLSKFFDNVHHANVRPVFHEHGSTSYHVALFSLIYQSPEQNKHTCPFAVGMKTGDSVAFCSPIKANYSSTASQKVQSCRANLSVPSTAPRGSQIRWHSLPVAIVQLCMLLNTCHINSYNISAFSAEIWKNSTSYAKEIEALIWINLQHSMKMIQI